jgi:serine/threonine protein kinase
MPESEREDPPERPETGPAPDPPPGDLELPASFGKYFLTEKLATGGMAEIYLGKIIGPSGFEKQLVIKQIHPKLSGQRHFVDLFVAEAKTLVTLAHGNIVPVYELGVIDDTYFIAMEYIDGPTLYRLTETLRRKDVVMAPAIAAWIAARILEGLDYAHRKGEGVIHRDLSPRNVMLSRDGEVKLVDFGIAVTLGAGSEDETGQSAPTGSFPYMSPEQVRKEPLTGRSDLFSVGVLLWEMLAGYRLFARSDPDATLSAVVDGDIPRPGANNPDVPGKLDNVVMRALERDMTARWASAADMLAALQRYLYGLEDPPGPRDVAALVAKYCPPETRRLPTHHDELGEHELPHGATSPRPRGQRAASTSGARPPSGPMTAVIPRDGTQPRGQRKPRARTETFATHVALDQILERAAPMSTSGHDAEDHPPATHDSVPARPEPPPIQLPGRTPPSTGLLLIAALGAVGLGAAAIYVFYHGRGAALAPPRVIDPRGPASEPGPSAALRHDAGSGLRELGAPALDAAAPVTETVMPTQDTAAPPLDAAELVRPTATNARASDPTGEDPRPAGKVVGVPTPRDRASPIDPTGEAPRPAGRAVGVPTPRDRASPIGSRRDAGVLLPRPDARETHLEPRELATRPDAGAVRPTGNATLTIGANPWGDVLLDGKRIGRTPIDHFSVSAGHHVINVIFGGEDPPRTLSYTVDLAGGETKDVLADFTKP